MSHKAKSQNSNSDSLAPELSCLRATRAGPPAPGKTAKGTVVPSWKRLPCTQAPSVCVLTREDYKVEQFNMDLAQLQQTGSVQSAASLLSPGTDVKTAHSHGLSVNPHSPDTPRCNLNTSVSHVETEAGQDLGMT